jgi:hypothetical protein
LNLLEAISEGPYAFEVWFEPRKMDDPEIYLFHAYVLVYMEEGFNHCVLTPATNPQREFAGTIQIIEGEIVLL